MYTGVLVQRSQQAMGTGSVKHKGARAKMREKIKGANQGPKRVGVTKPPPGIKPLAGVAGGRALGKKAKKEAATAAAWALIGDGGKQVGAGKKKQFSY